MADENNTKLPYKIGVGNGCVNVEAPTKKECIALFKAATSNKIVVKHPIDDALR
jgi:hypothetical protein